MFTWGCDDATKVGETMEEQSVIIVGAGLAGLSCAYYLKKQRIPFVILEASNAPGGRIRTDVLEGFQLDRGFQVFLTAYPEARRVLNYQELNLKSFIPGALVRYQGRFHRVSDPVRDPAHTIETLASPIGTLADKLQVARLKFKSPARNGRRQSTREALSEMGFSDSIIERFFRPFFAGIFLEKELQTTSRNFSFLFQMFSSGDTTLPELGMEEIPRQLALAIGIENIRLHRRVVAVAENTVALADGTSMSAAHIVVATEGSAASQLLFDAVPENSDNAVTCLYYGADTPPLSEPILVLNGEDGGLINNLCVPSQVSRAYAPQGKSLISVSVLGNPRLSDAELERQVRRELEDWYGAQVQQWQHLRTYRIENALPRQIVGSVPDQPPNCELRPGVYVCGDHMQMGSINGALESGRHVASLIGARITGGAAAAARSQA